MHDIVRSIIIIIIYINIITSIVYTYIYVIARLSMVTAYSQTSARDYTIIIIQNHAKSIVYIDRILYLSSCVVPRLPA